MNGTTDFGERQERSHALANRRGATFNYREVAIIFGFSALCIFWSLLIPFNTVPDEITHFFLVEYLYRFGTVPKPGIDPEMPFVGTLTGATYSNSDWWYYGVPHLYAIGATATAKAMAIVLPENVGYLGARAFNWLLSIPFAWAMIQSAKGIIENNTLQPLIISCIIIFLPQVVFVFSYYNSDGFGLTVLALSVCSFLRFYRKRTFASTIVYGACSGLVLATKLYFFPSLVFFLCFGLWRCLTGIDRFNPRLILLFAVAFTSAAILALVMTYIEFGDVTGIPGQRAFTEIQKHNPSAMYGTCYVYCPNGLVNSETFYPWLKILFKSFFAVFGRMNVFLPSWIYDWIFRPLTVCFAVGSVIAVIFSIRDKLLDRAFLIGLFWMMLLGTAAMSLAQSQFGLPQAQGRYLFVVIPFLPYIVTNLVDAFNPSTAKA